MFSRFRSNPAPLRNRIAWKTESFLRIREITVPCAGNLSPGYHQGCGIKHHASAGLTLRRLLWPLLKLSNDLFTDGFIDTEITRLIRRHTTPASVFLDIGCGSMDLRKSLPPGNTYNALDLQISELHILRCCRVPEVNLVVASAKDIPIEDCAVDVAVSSETLEHIPDVEIALREIRRVLKNEAVFIVSIPNNHCHKYAVKGQHPGHVNRWHYEDFVHLMSGYGFRLLEGFMKGYWIRIPGWLAKRSYQLPYSSPAEYMNTNFFYVFRLFK